MSVLIRGMDMPKEEELLCIRIYPNGKVGIDMDLACKQVATAVPVPTHGRLIDADAILKEHMQHYDLLADEFYIFVRDIEEAPTIIEAEEE